MMTMDNWGHIADASFANRLINVENSWNFYVFIGSNVTYHILHSKEALNRQFNKIDSQILPAMFQMCLTQMFVFQIIQFD